MRKLKYERFIDDTTYGFTKYKEDLLCRFINENQIEQKDIQKIHINDYEIQLFYWEE